MASSKHLRRIQRENTFIMASRPTRPLVQQVLAEVQPPKGSGIDEYANRIGRSGALGECGSVQRDLCQREHELRVPSAFLGQLGKNLGLANRASMGCLVSEIPNSSRSPKRSRRPPRRACRNHKYRFQGYFQILAIHNAICSARLYHSGYPRSLTLLFRSADQRLRARPIRG